MTCFCRAVAAETAAAPALDVTMARDLPELTTVIPRLEDPQDLISTAQEPEWDPTEGGLPEDITDALTEPPTAVLAKVQTQGLNCFWSTDYSGLTGTMSFMPSLSYMCKLEMRPQALKACHWSCTAELGINSWDSTTQR